MMSFPRKRESRSLYVSERGENLDARLRGHDECGVAIVALLSE